MKKSKKIYIICIAIIVLIIAGAGGYYIWKTNSTVNEVNLIEIDFSELGDIRVISLGSNEKYLVVNYMDYVDGIMGGEIDEEIKINYYLALFDIRKNKLIKTKIYEDSGDNYEIIVENDRIKLRKTYLNEEIIFDYNLDKIGIEEYDYQDLYEKWEQVETVDIRRFLYEKEYAITNSFNEYINLVFYDEPENYYFLKNDDYIYFKKALEHKILVYDNTGNKIENYDNVIKIYDFDNNEIESSITIKNETSFNNAEGFNFNEKYVSFHTTDEDGKTKAIYLWNYNKDKKCEAFAENYCTKIASKDVENKINDIVKEINNQYEIKVEVQAEKEFFDYKSNNNQKLIMYYETMLELQKSLSYFPKELYQEILCKDIKDSVCPFDEIRIYIVGEFEDPIAGYASNIGSDETDGKLILYMVFSCTEFNSTVFSHELMHNMEYRIWYYENDFDLKWIKLNPKKFDYTEDYGELFYKKEEYQEYFTRDYGMKTILEDRATCFETICQYNLGKVENYWENKKLNKKIEYLFEILQKSYPSLKESNINEIMKNKPSEF